MSEYGKRENNVPIDWGSLVLHIYIACREMGLGKDFCSNYVIEKLEEITRGSGKLVPVWMI